MEWLPRQREHRFTQRFVLGGVRVDERRDIGGQGLPGDGQLGLTDQLADAVADHVHTDHRSGVAGSDDLDPTRRLQNLALAVAREVVHDGRDVAVPFAGGILGEADGRDLGVRVRHPRNEMLGHGNGIEAGDLLRHEHPVLESAVRQLKSRHDVADGIHPVDVGAQPPVGDDEP